MRFGYSRVGDNTLRPFLDVRLSGPRGIFRARMLVDSGADQTMIPAALYRELGLEDTGQVELGGVGGNVLGREAEVDFRCAAGNWSGHVVGAPMDPSFPPVLGHRDFFRHFLVCFDTLAGGFSIEARRVDQSEPE